VLDSDRSAALNGASYWIAHLFAKHEHLRDSEDAVNDGISRVRLEISKEVTRCRDFLEMEIIQAS
jgi:hypothetical protein